MLSIMFREYIVLFVVIFLWRVSYQSCFRRGPCTSLRIYHIKRSNLYSGSTTKSNIGTTANSSLNSKNASNDSNSGIELSDVNLLGFRVDRLDEIGVCNYNKAFEFLYNRTDKSYQGNQIRNGNPMYESYIKGLSSGSNGSSSVDNPGVGSSGSLSSGVGSGSLSSGVGSSRSLSSGVGSSRSLSSGVGGGNVRGDGRALVEVSIDLSSDFGGSADAGRTIWYNEDHKSRSSTRLQSVEKNPFIKKKRDSLVTLKTYDDLLEERILQYQASIKGYENPYKAFMRRSSGDLRSLRGSDLRSLLRSNRSFKSDVKLTPAEDIEKSVNKLLATNYHIPRIGKALRRSGFPPILAGGTALGFYRQCGMIYGDPDADFWMPRFYFEDCVPVSSTSVSSDIKVQGHISAIFNHISSFFGDHTPGGKKTNSPGGINHDSSGGGSNSVVTTSSNYPIKCKKSYKKFVSLQKSMQAMGYKVFSSHRKLGQIGWQFTILPPDNSMYLDVFAVDIAEKGAVGGNARALSAQDMILPSSNSTTISSKSEKTVSVSKQTAQTPTSLNARQLAVNARRQLTANTDFKGRWVWYLNPGGGDVRRCGGADFDFSLYAWLGTTFWAPSGPMVRAATSSSTPLEPSLLELPPRKLNSKADSSVDDFKANLPKSNLNSTSIVSIVDNFDKYLRNEYGLGYVKPGGGVYKSCYSNRIRNQNIPEKEFQQLFEKSGSDQSISGSGNLDLYRQTVLLPEPSVLTMLQNKVEEMNQETIRDSWEKEQTLLPPLSTIYCQTIPVVNLTRPPGRNLSTGRNKLSRRNEVNQTIVSKQDSLFTTTAEKTMEESLLTSNNDSSFSTMRGDINAIIVRSIEEVGNSDEKPPDGRRLKRGIAQQGIELLSPEEPSITPRRLRETGRVVGTSEMGIPGVRFGEDPFWSDFKIPEFIFNLYRSCFVAIEVVDAIETNEGEPRNLATTQTNNKCTESFTSAIGLDYKGCQTSTIGGFRCKNPCRNQYKSYLWCDVVGGGWDWCLPRTLGIRRLERGGAANSATEKSSPVAAASSTQPQASSIAESSAIGEEGSAAESTQGSVQPNRQGEEEKGQGKPRLLTGQSEGGGDGRRFHSKTSTTIHIISKFDSRFFGRGYVEWINPKASSLEQDNPLFPSVSLQKSSVSLEISKSAFIKGKRPSSSLSAQETENRIKLWKHLTSKNAENRLNDKRALNLSKAVNNTTKDGTAPGTTTASSTEANVVKKKRRNPENLHHNHPLMIWELRKSFGVQHRDMPSRDIIPVKRCPEIEITTTVGVFEKDSGIESEFDYFSVILPKMSRLFGLVASFGINSRRTVLEIGNGKTADYLKVQNYGLITISCGEVRELQDSFYDRVTSQNEDDNPSKGISPATLSAGDDSYIKNDRYENRKIDYTCTSISYQNCFTNLQFVKQGVVDLVVVNFNQFPSLELLLDKKCNILSVHFKRILRKGGCIWFNGVENTLTSDTQHTHHRSQSQNSFSEFSEWYNCLITSNAGNAGAQSGYTFTEHTEHELFGVGIKRTFVACMI